MVSWPAIIKYVNDDELTFINSPEEINSHPDLHDIRFNPGDVLIDAAGKVHALRNALGHIEIAQESEVALTLDFVVELVRKHASICGECCISKISATTIAEAIHLINDMQRRRTR
ncbi:hypothetical protein JWZ97_15220 [Methylococcus sp. EFPC2]|nr:hypothetical protein JWZ97_15220 [Methylococcus sp. EFPC2]